MESDSIAMGFDKKEGQLFFYAPFFSPTVFMVGISKLFIGFQGITNDIYVVGLFFSIYYK